MTDGPRVLDASALIAALLREPGADIVAPLLAHARISAVNLSEVVAKLAERGVPHDTIDESIDELELTVVPFDTRQAVLAGHLRPATRAMGLSLGDRACLALARTLDLPAVTTDARWRDADVDIAIEVIR